MSKNFTILKKGCVQASYAQYLYINVTKIRCECFREASLYADSAWHSPGKHCTCLLPHPASFLTENPLCLWRPLCNTKDPLQDHCILYRLCSMARASVEANRQSFLPQSLGLSLHPSPCSRFMSDDCIGELPSCGCNEVQHAGVSKLVMVFSRDELKCAEDKCVHTIFQQRCLRPKSLP